MCQATERLLDRLARLTLRPGTHLDELYHFSTVPGRGAVSDLAAGPVAVEEILADHANEDCWRVQRTPHRIARQLYVNVLPALAALAGGGSAEALHLARTALRAHLGLWEVWLDLFSPAGSTGASRRSRTDLTGWCQQAGDVLAASGLAAATSSVTAIALLTDVSPAQLLTWGGLAGHADELFFAKLALKGLSPTRRMALAPCFSSPLAAVLAGHQRAGPRPQPARPVLNVDLARAASGDPNELAGVCALGWRHCLAGDTMAFRKLVRAWKATRGGDSVRLEGMLLAAELGTSSASLPAGR
jgi:hypothetical protein